jgi:two-component system response regulator (stage 0 sporulation protein A)
MQQKIKVLIADPCGDYRRLVTQQINRAPDLELTGSTENGSEALRIALETKPDVLVCDIQLTHLGGISMIHCLQAQQVDVSAILVSNFRADSRCAEILALGIYCILLKPFNTETLLEVIRSVSGRGDEEPVHCKPALERAVTEILVETGIPPHLKGFRYLREAVVRTVSDTSHCWAMAKSCYPILARKFNTVPARVERAMRHAIEVSWEYSDRNTLRKLFGDTTSKHNKVPTNSEWIISIAECVTKQLEHTD